MAHRRWFLTGSILWLLTGIAHWVGQFATGNEDVAYRSVVAMMRGYSIVPGGSFSLFDFMQNLGLCWPRSAASTGFRLPSSVSCW